MYPCGDHALTIEWGNEIDVSVNKSVIALFKVLQEANIKGVKDIIPAYNSVTVVYDTALLKKDAKTKTVYEWVSREVGKLIDIAVIDTEKNAKLVRIPVCYDISLAPDLVSLAAEHNLTIEEVVKLHVGKTYRVYMIGFLPGFAYMGSVDERIATPRKKNPRTMVPAGSVGIAGEQTGVYPFDSPGGWQLIGQTPVNMFSATKAEPCLLQPGDDVQFYPVTITEFEKIKADVATHS
jgi:inhibitor of KinA